MLFNFQDKLSFFYFLMFPIGDNCFISMFQEWRKGLLSNNASMFAYKKNVAFLVDTIHVFCYQKKIYAVLKNSPSFQRSEKKDFYTIT